MAYQQYSYAHPSAHFWRGVGTRSHAAVQPQRKVARGKVISTTNARDVFRGDEVLEVSVSDASRMDVASTLLGRQRIPLQLGQQFPIRFQFYYDQSRAAPAFGSLTMRARIINGGGQLKYTNDTYTPLINNVKIDVRPT